jgi:hypothetical protein
MSDTFYEAKNVTVKIYKISWLQKIFGDLCHVRGYTEPAGEKRGKRWRNIWHLRSGPCPRWPFPGRKTPDRFGWFPRWSLGTIKKSGRWNDRLPSLVRGADPKTGRQSVQPCVPTLERGNNQKQVVAASRKERPMAITIAGMARLLPPRLCLSVERAMPAIAVPGKQNA